MDAKAAQQLMSKAANAIGANAVSVIADIHGGSAINNTEFGLDEMIRIHGNFERACRRMREGVRDSIRQEFGAAGLLRFDSGVETLASQEVDGLFIRSGSVE